MGILPDREIRKRIKIEPFAEEASRPGVISYGLSSYGYDLRVGRKFKIFTNVYGAVVDPKNFHPNAFVDFEGDVCVIPPNSFALAETVEYIEMPRDVLGVCVGKCLAGSSRVVDASTGDYLPIRDFVKNKVAKTVSLNGWVLGSNLVRSHIPSGVKPVFTVLTACGRNLKVTDNHPFKTINGWVPLKDLKVGDRISVARSCPVFGNESPVEHEVALLALLTADGACTDSYGSPGYTKNDPVMVNELRRVAAAFGVQVSSRGKSSYCLVNKLGRGGSRVNCQNKVAAWLKAIGCAELSINKRVPGLVFRAKRDLVATFLRTLFSGDGSVFESKSKNEETLSLHVEYYTSSPTLAEDVAHLLLRFGLFFRVASKVSASGRPAYRVATSDIEMVRRFCSEIGFLPGCEKDVKLKGLLLKHQGRSQCKSNFDTLPNAAGALLYQAAKEANTTLNAMGVKLTHGQSVSYPIASTVAEITGSKEVAAIVNSDVVWDTIKSITPEGEEEVFDIEVPGVHNFVANDIIVHNSTYARCGIIINVTPIEPEWRGKITIEISNTTPLPAKIYANEGIAQLLFFEGTDFPEKSYADKKGKYQDQPGLVLPIVLKE